MGSKWVVRLEMELRGFKTWLLLLITALGTPWDLLDQNLASINELDEEMKVCPILGEDVSWKLGGDVESLRDELAKLKLAKEVLFCLCGATAILEDKEKMWRF
ncbi:hypothetical protein Tco_1491211 [Tanacetum coccineum]